MSDFKTIPTVNGVPVSLYGHTHDFGSFSVPIAKVKPGGAQAYTANIATKVLFTTVEFSNLIVANTASSRLTIPASVPGLGIFNIKVNLRLNSTSTMYIRIYVNGAQREEPYYLATGVTMHTISTDLDLAPNDYVEIYILGATGRTIQSTSSITIRQVA